MTKTKEQICVSKKTGKIYIVNEDTWTIDIHSPVERDLKLYKKVNDNNLFEVFEKRKS
jgi:hypothetical protein